MNFFALNALINRIFHQKSQIFSPSIFLMFIFSFLSIFSHSTVTMFGIQFRSDFFLHLLLFSNYERSSTDIVMRNSSSTRIRKNIWFDIFTHKHCCTITCSKQFRWYIKYNVSIALRTLEIPFIHQWNGVNLHKYLSIADWCEVIKLIHCKIERTYECVPCFH